MGGTIQNVRLRHRMLLTLSVGLLGSMCMLSAALARDTSRPPRVLTVARVRTLCSRTPIRASNQVVVVRGFYWDVQIGSEVVEFGAMWDRALPADVAYQVSIRPAGGGEQRLTATLAKGALVVQGPATLLPPGEHTQGAIPRGAWVVVRGTLHCRSLRGSTALEGAAKTPVLYEKSWRLSPPTPVATSTPTPSA